MSSVYRARNNIEITPEMLLTVAQKYQMVTLSQLISAFGIESGKKLWNNEKSLEDAMYWASDEQLEEFAEILNEKQV